MALVEIRGLKKSFRKGGETVAVLRGGIELPVARSRREDLERRLAALPPAR